MEKSEMGFSMKKPESSALIKLTIFYGLFYLANVFYCKISEIYEEIVFVRSFLWLGPIFLYLYLEGKNPIAYLKLNIPMSRFFFLCITVLALFAFFVTYFIKGALNFNHSLSTWIDVILLVGITEESVFRGFIQQELEEIFQNFSIAVVISSILFALMHIPYAKLVGFTLRDYFYIALGGLIFSIIFKKTNSLWAASYIHSIHNLIVMVCK